MIEKFTIGNTVMVANNQNEFNGKMGKVKGVHPYPNRIFYSVEIQPGIEKTFPEYMLNRIKKRYEDINRKEI